MLRSCRPMRKRLGSAAFLCGFILALVFADNVHAQMMSEGQAGQAGQAEQAAEDLRQSQRALSEARRERERLAKEREETALELARLRRSLILTAQDAQEREALVTSLEAQIVKLGAERDQRRLALENNRQEMSLVTGALVRVARSNPSAILLQPGPPQNTARSAILFRATAPALAERAAILRDELVALDAVEAELAKNIQTLSSAESALSGERKALNDLIIEKRALLSQSETAMTQASQQIEALVSQANSLRDLLEKLATAQIAPSDLAAPLERNGERSGTAGLETQNLASPPQIASRIPQGPPEGLRPFPAEGPVNRPISGTVLQEFGAKTGFGQESRGVVIGARLGAFVTAPFDGRIAFSGQFQNLGDIIIIEHQGGFHTVLAGFSRIDVQSGQWILAGEPVGIVGRFDTEEARATLYVELRRDGAPVNPLRWRG